jgi:hypothetical protein
MLRCNGNLRRLRDTRRAPTIQLRGTKAGQHRELERIHPVWTFDHHRPLRRVSEPNAETGAATTIAGAAHEQQSPPKRGPSNAGSDWSGITPSQASRLW